MIACGQATISGRGAGKIFSETGKASSKVSEEEKHNNAGTEAEPPEIDGGNSRSKFHKGGGLLLRPCREVPAPAGGTIVAPLEFRLSRPRSLDDEKDPEEDEKDEPIEVVRRIVSLDGVRAVHLTMIPSGPPKSPSKRSSIHPYVAPPSSAA